MLNLEVKVRLYVLAILPYGTQTWSMTVVTKKKVRSKSSQVVEKDNGKDTF